MVNERFLNHAMQQIIAPGFDFQRYKIAEQIGAGGMGVVYSAFDTKLDREVAVKLVKNLENVSELSIRMQREAKIVAQLEHPGIVPIHDVGSLEDGRVFYVMRRVFGSDLNEFIEQHPRLGDRLRVFERICETVSYAHENGIIHRDLKPQNIMLGRFGEVLILDWGIAKFQETNSSIDLSETDEVNVDTITRDNVDFDCTQTWQTKFGMVVGTPAYMPPEAARGMVDQIDFSSDVFSLGAILYLMLTGEMLIDRSNFEKIRMEQLESLPQARTIKPEIPRNLNAICAKAIEIKQSMRYQTANELREDIRRYLNDVETIAYKTPRWERIAKWAAKYQAFLWMILFYLLIRGLMAALS